MSNLTDIFNFKIFKQIQGSLSSDKVDRLKSLVMLLHTSANIREGVRLEFSKFGISQSKYYILILLHEKGDDLLKPSQIADFTGISRATVSGLIDGLEQDGLIERHMDREDRRMMRVSITEKGKEVLRQILPYDCQATLKLLSCLSDEEITSLINITNKLDKQLKESNKEKW